MLVLLWMSDFDFFLFVPPFSSFSDLCRDAKVDVLLAVQPVISDGRLAPVLAQDWEHPPVLWATPEQQVGEMISGNSLVFFFFLQYKIQSVVVQLTMTRRPTSAFAHVIRSAEFLFHIYTF